ncbi:hypothetical protein FRC01_007407 [Tulasnella sp. 417]|nr:hypothetical protein FRC01_007407 [Tulasnella sp. 417]
MPTANTSATRYSSARPATPPISTPHASLNVGSANVVSSAAPNWAARTSEQLTARASRPVQHHRDADDDDIPFDTELSSTEPPKMRRVGSSSSASGSSSPGSLDSLLGHLESRGPSDDELFRLSEEKRRVLMERTRKEHAKWMGGEDALKAAVPDYPIWTRREYPYGRAPSVEPEPSKQEPQEPVDPFVPTTTTQAWYGGSLTYPDPLLPNCTAPILPYQLSSPTTVSSGLEWGIPPPPGALSSSPPLAPPYEQFYSPETPYNDNFLATLSGTSSNSIYSSQSLDDAASSDLSVLGVLPQAHLIQNITPELYFDLTFPKWTSR